MNNNDVASDSRLEKLKAQSAKMDAGLHVAFADKKKEIDPRFWRPTADGDGMGFFVIRLLPPADFESREFPWFYHARHNFVMPTGLYYNENCIKSTGKACPACSILDWDDYDEAKQAIYRSRKAFSHWIANIIVISDSVNPENNSKVFLWNMTKTFYDAILDAWNGKTSEKIKFNAFDVLNGAAMKIQIKTTGKKKNRETKYTVTWSDKIGRLITDDKKLDMILNRTYSLSELESESKYLLKESLVLANILSKGFGVTETETQDPPIQKRAEKKINTDLDDAFKDAVFDDTKTDFEIDDDNDADEDVDETESEEFDFSIPDEPVTEPDIKTANKTLQKNKKKKTDLGGIDDLDEVDDLIS